jgi:hypothetical protein
MIKGLTERANKVAEDARSNASWSDRIPNAISVGKAEKTSNGFVVSIKIDSRPDGPAPHAAAFEYGSGERGPKGEAYLIEPKKGGGKLVISRSRWPKYVESDEDVMGGIIRDPIILSSVFHPGVKARPYMQPAIDKNRNVIKETLRKIFKSAYLDSTVKVTVISARK